MVAIIPKQPLTRRIINCLTPHVRETVLRQRSSLYPTDADSEQEPAECEPSSAPEAPEPAPREPDSVPEAPEPAPRAPEPRRSGLKPKSLARPPKPPCKPPPEHLLGESAYGIPVVCINGLFAVQQPTPVAARNAFAAQQPKPSAAEQLLEPLVAPLVGAPTKRPRYTSDDYFVCAYRAEAHDVPTVLSSGDR
jgi:hypothetical protein